MIERERSAKCLTDEGNTWFPLKERAKRRWREREEGERDVRLQYTVDMFERTRIEKPS